MMGSEWTYHGKVIKTEADFPEKTLGFVYRITNLKSGKFYYGKKLALFKKTSVRTVVLKDGTKKKKKISVLVPSDWKTYFSSSSELIADVEKNGKENFSREILCFCENKGSLGYYELKYQMDARVLEIGDATYNGIVSCRIHWKHIKPVLTF